MDMYKMDLTEKEVKSIGYNRGLKKNKRLYIAGLVMAFVCFISMLWIPLVSATITFVVSMACCLVLLGISIKRAENAGKELVKLMKGEYDE